MLEGLVYTDHAARPVTEETQDLPRIACSLTVAPDLRAQTFADLDAVDAAIDRHGVTTGGPHGQCWGPDHCATCAHLYTVRAHLNG